MFRLSLREGNSSKCTQKLYVMNSGISQNFPVSGTVPVTVCAKTHTIFPPHFIISSYQRCVHLYLPPFVNVTALIKKRRYFRALYKLYSVSTEEGIALYGAHFRSATWLVREHLAGAASKQCDHWHDDAGVMNHHIGITWQFENSMRVSAMCCHCAQNTQT